MCLEITSQHAKKSGEKYGGRKNTKHRHGIAAHQDSRAKEGKQAGQAAHDYHIAYGTAENFLGVPVFPQRQPLGNHLGNGRRDTVGGYEEYDGINLISGRIITISFIPDNCSQRASV